MLLTAVPAVAWAVLLLVSPGVVWAWWGYPSPRRAVRLCVGVALGLAYQMHICALLALGPGITRASVVVETIIALALAAVFAWRTRIPRIPSLSSEHESERVTRGWTYGALMIAMLAAITALRLLPLAHQQVPQGWDPSFHSLLASVTVDTGKLPNWRPFEPIDSNYPYGPHVFIAQVSLLTGVAPASVFAVLLNGFLPPITGLAVYALARRVLRREDAALGAVAAYSFLGDWGSIDYGAWGGLPNALGFFLLLTFLAVFFAAGFGRRRIVVGGILLGAIPLAHHHVMLTTMLLLGVYAAYLIVSLFVRRIYSLRGQGFTPGALLRLFISLALMSIVALVTVSYYAIPLAARAGQLHDTTALRYFDHDPGLIFARNGVLLWIAACTGMCMIAWSASYIWQRLGTHQAKLAGKTRTHTTTMRRWLFEIPGVAQVAGCLGQPQAFLAVASAVLLAAFLLGFYGYRAYALHVYHQPYTAFTPTRFLTDLTYFLAIYAGPALAALWHSVAHLTRVLFGGRARATRAVIRVATQGALALALVVLAGQTVYAEQVGNGAGQLAAGELDAFTWVRTHTPTNALVINLDPNNRWAPYFTRRESYNTPVPVSEFTTGYIAEKQALVNTLLDARAQMQHAQIVALASDGTALPTLTQRPAAVITDHPLMGFDSSLAFSSGPERVYLLPDTLALTDTKITSAGDSEIQWYPIGQAMPPKDWMQSQVVTAKWNTQDGNAMVPTPDSAYMRIALHHPLPRGAEIMCAAQDGVTLYIDGQHAPNGLCSGQLTPLPTLSSSGSGEHLFAAHITHNGDAHPWFDLLIVAPGAAPPNV